MPTGADVDITFGADTSAVTAGLAELRNQVSQTARSFTSAFTSGFTGAAIVAEVQKVLDAASEVHKQSERFGIDAEQFQKISNAAKEFGIEGGTVARAMNLMQLNAEKALVPTSKQAKALEDLGISAEQFAAAKPWEKVLMLSNSYTTAADQGKAYADVAQIVGTRNTELVALFEQGAIKIQELAAQFPVLSNAEIKALHDMKVAEDVYRANLSSNVATLTVIWGGLFNFLRTGIANLGVALMKPFDPNLSFFGVQQNQAAELAKRIQYLQSIMITPPGVGGAVKGGEPGAGAGLTDIAASAGAAVAGLTRVERLQDQLTAAMQRSREAQAGQINLEERLNVIQQERARLQEEYMRLRDSGVATEDQLLQLSIEAENKFKEELDTEKKITDQKQAQKDAEADFLRLQRQHTAEVQRELEASQRRVELINLEAMGATEAADQMQLQAKFEGEIQKAIDAANKAYEIGDRITGDMNMKLAQQLGIEEQVAIAALHAAQMRAATLATIRAQIDLDVARGRTSSEMADFEQKFVDLQLRSQQLGAEINGALLVGNTALALQLSLEKQITDQLAQQAANRAAQANLMARGPTAASIPYGVLGYFAAHGLSAGAGADIYTAAYAAAHGIQPGTAAYDQLRLEEMAREQLRNLTGQNLGFFEQAQRDALVRQYAAQQNLQATQAAAQARQQEIDYWTSIAMGRAPSGANPYNALFGIPNFATGQLMAAGTYAGGQFLPGTTASTDVQIAQLSTQIGIMQQQLTQLQQINTRLTPTPGLH